MIPTRYIDEIDEEVQPYHPLNPVLFRELLITLIREHNELEERVKRIEQREPA